MTRYWLDTEFIDDGRTIDLISIGIVCEDGRELYLQSTEFNPRKASRWVQENVFPDLSLCPHIHTRGKSSAYVDLVAHKDRGQCTFERPARAITGLRGVNVSGGYLIGAHIDCYWRTREQMKSELFHFMDVSKYGKPELWGWCSAYDFVALCQLFGTMMDLPQGYPHYIKDLQYLLDERGMSDDELPQQEDGVHNALSDARHIKRLWNCVTESLW